MHPNPAFRTTQTGSALAFAADRGFGVLAINAENGPTTAHIPFVIDAGQNELRAHVVSSNPLYKQVSTGPTPALLSVSGPDSYVSPDWYGLGDQVPTWNYVAVNIRGILSAAPIEDLRRNLDEISARFESQLAPKPSWTTDKMPAELLARMMRQIRPITMRIEAVESTFKLGQNKPDHARIAAASQVAAANLGHETADLAALMKDRR